MSRCAVYLIRTTSPIYHQDEAEDGHGIFKVGITSSPRGRLDTLQTAHPWRLEMLYCGWLPSRNEALKIEREFHEDNKGRRLAGEWFYDSIIGSLENLNYSICIHAFEELGLSGSDLIAYLTATGMSKQMAGNVIAAQYGEEAFG